MVIKHMMIMLMNKSSTISNTSCPQFSIGNRFSPPTRTMTQWPQHIVSVYAYIVL